jgi:hypothetical protein
MNPLLLDASGDYAKFYGQKAQAHGTAGTIDGRFRHQPIMTASTPAGCRLAVLSDARAGIVAP